VAKNHKRGTFLNTIWDVWSNRGTKHEMGDTHILNGEAGHYWTPVGDGSDHGRHKIFGQWTLTSFTQQTAFVTQQ